METDLRKIKLSQATLQEYVVARMTSDYDSLKEIAVREYFDGLAYHTNDSEQKSFYEHRKIQFVFKEFFEKNEYSLDKEISFGHLNQLPPVMVEMEIAPEKYMKIYKEAMLFYTKKNEKIIVEIMTGHHGTILYTVYSTDKNNKILRDIESLSKEKNLYKGKKIDCDCRFLKLDDMSWDDVILPESTKNIIKANVNDLFSFREDFKKYKIAVKRGVILYGPPGTGKTLACRCLAKDAQFSVLYALPTDFSPQKGGVRRVCKMAQDLAPCLLIVEDIDWIAQDRHEGNAGFVMELMNQLDGMESFGDIVTLGTTNCLEDLEEAVKNRPGRFDRLINIGKPTEKCREQMIVRFTRQYVLSNDVNTNKLSKSLDKLSGAHIKDLCITAAMFAVKAKSEENGNLLLRKAHFDEAIKEVIDKDYSSYITTQGKAKAMGFGGEPGTGMDDFLEDENY